MRLSFSGQKNIYDLCVELKKNILGRPEVLFIARHNERAN